MKKQQLQVKLYHHNKISIPYPVCKRINSGTGLHSTIELPDLLKAAETMNQKKFNKTKNKNKKNNKNKNNKNKNKKEIKPKKAQY